MTISRIVSIVSALAVVALIVGIFQHRPAPRYHTMPVAMPGDVPATLYYTDPPGTSADAPPTIYLAPAQGLFRAGVVVAHGFAVDRHTMEGLSESLAGAGYVVLSLDMSGHGLNSNPYATGQNGPLIRDIRMGVQFLKQYTWVEPAKITVLGHSMGAGAALDYGSREAGVGGLVMLSGGAVQSGRERPRNTLFLYAENDLPIVKPLIRRAAASLAGANPFEERKTYGDFAAGTAVRLVQIPGVAHGTILSSPVAFTEVVNWLDQVTGFPARGSPPALIENPLGPPLLWFSFFLVLPGLGLLLARLAPEPPAASQARWPDLGMLPVALLLPLPFLAVGRPGVLVGLSLADTNVTHLALAGVLLVVSLILLGRFRIAFLRLPGALAVAAAGWLAVSALLAPASAYFHGVGLTPEKARLTVWSALCLAPFALAMQWLLCRPQWWRTMFLRVVARIVVIASVGAGIALGAFGFPGIIAIFVLIACLAIIEPVLAGFYGRSRNVLAAAGFDAIVTGWLFALLLPTTL